MKTETVRITRGTDEGGKSWVKVINWNGTLDHTYTTASQRLTQLLTHITANQDWTEAWAVAEIDETPQGRQLVRLVADKEPLPWDVNPG